MKHRRIINTLAVAGLFALGATSNAQKELVSATAANGGFEGKALKPWYGNFPEQNVTLEEDASAPEGRKVCHIKLVPEEGGKKAYSLVTDVSNIDLAAGLNFGLKVDAKRLPGKPAPEIRSEIVLMQGRNVIKVSQLESKSPKLSEEWQTLEFTLKEPLPDDLAGDTIQLRIIFYAHDGTPGEEYEALIDNVSFSQN